MNFFSKSLEPRCFNCGRRDVITYIDGRPVCPRCARINFECDSKRIIKENFGIKDTKNSNKK